MHSDLSVWIGSAGHPMQIPKTTCRWKGLVILLVQRREAKWLLAWSRRFRQSRTRHKRLIWKGVEKMKIETDRNQTAIRKQARCTLDLLKWPGDGSGFWPLVCVISRSRFD